jgi:peptidyl-prolyl cis-trans isomerase SurA
MKSINGLIKGLILTSAALFALVGVRAQDGEMQEVDAVIARVNSDVVLKSMYTRELQNMIEEFKQRGLKDQELEKKVEEVKPTLLDNLIDQMLLVQRAKELSIDVEPQVNQQLVRIMEENGLKSLEELEQKMREVGVDINEVKRNLRAAFLADAVRMREVYRMAFVQLTEKEKRDYYEKHKEWFVVPGEVTLSRIFIQGGKNPLQSAQVLEKAKGIAAQARGGAVEFGTLVERVSEDDPKLVKEKGKVGTVKVPDLAPAVREAVGTAPVGTVTDPIKLDNGYAIFRVDARKEQVTRPFEDEEVKNAVSQRMAYERGQEQMEDYLKKLRADAFIEIDARYQMPGSRVTSAQIKRTPYSEESEKERKKREKREKKEKEQQEKEAAKAKEAAANSKP